MGFGLQPVLRGELLTLRPLTAEDYDELFAVASDPLIWAQHPQSDRYKPDVFRQFFAKAMASGGALVAIDNANGRIIGSSRFVGYDPSASEIQIGWTFLARSHWGGAYNLQMKRLMLAHAFRFVDNVVFLVGPGNVRSQQALARLGIHQAGMRLNDDGDEQVLFRLTAQEFGAW